MFVNKILIIIHTVSRTNCNKNWTGRGVGGGGLLQTLLCINYMRLWLVYMYLRYKLHFTYNFFFFDLENLAIPLWLIVSILLLILVFLIGLFFYFCCSKYNRRKNTFITNPCDDKHEAYNITSMSTPATALREYGSHPFVKYCYLFEFTKLLICMLLIFCYFLFI